MAMTRRQIMAPTAAPAPAPAPAQAPAQHTAAAAAESMAMTLPQTKALTAGPEQRMQSIRDERHMFSSSDEGAVTRQILSTHIPDGRDVDARPLLQIVEDILHRATPTIVIVPPTNAELVDDKTHHVGLAGMLEALAYTIHKISCELSCKCAGGGDAHATTVAVFNLLGSYPWDAKLVLALAAFAVGYGEFWLTAQLYTVNPLAKSIAMLKQLPDILEHTESMKPRFDALNNLVKAVLDVTKCIIEFKELPTDYITPETPAMVMAMTHIPTTVYWAIRSIVACSSQIIGLIGVGHEYMTSTTEAWELSSLAHKVSNINIHLRKQLSQCQQHIDEKKGVEAFQMLVHLFETIHFDNMKILKALISSREELALKDASSQRRVGVDVLRRKIVALFISDFDVVQEELFVLTQIYNDSHYGKIEKLHEVVWLPVLDRTNMSNEEKMAAFNHLANQMPWYTLAHPSLVEHAVIRYIREMWHFDKKPMLVVLDTQGKVTSLNAIHMWLIWGAIAYPFSTVREENLWKDETWRLEFLVDEIDPLLLTWIREGRFVCLYGGEDLEWVRKFATAMKRVALQARLPLEMVYVGKSNPRERMRKNIAVVTQENLSHTWSENMIWFFWIRLESMWHSKMHHGRTIESDHIMQEIMTLLSFDGSDEGWALIYRGPNEIVKSSGKKIMECLIKFDTWKENAERDGFLPALTNALLPYQTHEHCTRLILPGNTGEIQESVICAECKRPMEKYILYRCCRD